MSKAICSAAVAVGVMLVGTPSALAAPVLDANCPGPANGNVNAFERNAQTFTAQTTGTLVQGQIEVRKDAPGGDWIMALYTTDGAGVPTNNALGAAVILDATVPSGPATLTGLFAPAPSVVAGQTYALSISRSPNTGYFMRERSDNPCPGNEYVSSSTSGAWFISAGVFDFIFATFVEPPATAQPEPVTKADGTLTIDANKGKVEKGRKVTLTGQLDMPANESCEQNRQIQIQRRLKSQDDSKFATFETVNTDATGNFSTKEKVKKTYFYRAVVSETEVCDDETSNSQKVRVQKKKAAQEA